MSSAKSAIFICGPTAVGKTSVSLELAGWLNTDIVSFDSRQLFEELKIGSAPPSLKEQAAVKHHFIGSHQLSDEMSAGIYGDAALPLMNQLFQQRDQIVLVGGSGLYMKAITEGFDQIPSVDEAYRKQLNESYSERGLKFLQDELYQADPEYYEVVDLKNPQRLIRALEVVRGTGKKYSTFRKGKNQQRDFQVIKIGLELPREELYEKINLRTDQMLDAGLEKEVKALRPYWEKSALKTVGYDEFVAYFRGEISKSEAIELIKRNSRRYAKRQLTWFRRDKEVHWFSPKDIDGMKKFISELI